MTDEELIRLLHLKAEELNMGKDCSRDLVLSKTLMTIAEIELKDTFDEKQLALYKTFCEKREIFYATAKKHYREINEDESCKTKKD